MTILPAHATSEAVQSGIVLRIEGVPYDRWNSAACDRNLKDFSGSYDFSMRDVRQSNGTFQYASTGPLLKIKLGQKVEVLVDGEVQIVGFLEGVERDVDESRAEIRISGRDKTGDLVDCAALDDGPAEFKNVKLEEAVKRIAAPYGITVRSEIDTGEPFARYGLDLSETAFSAIEKGARGRHALVLSDGVGGIVITRTGKTRAPADLNMPGNVKRSHGKFGHFKRHSKHTVHGQGEKAGKSRSGKPLDSTAEPLSPGDRHEGDGSATAMERKGTAAKGVAADDEIKRHRPIVHLARTKSDHASANDEADGRMRKARAESEELTHTVVGFGVDGKLWKVNQMASVSDDYQDIYRDLLITRVKNRQDEGGKLTELTLMSPEAFDKLPVGKRRTNAKGKGKKKKSGPLDGTAKGL